MNTATTLRFAVGCLAFLVLACQNPSGSGGNPGGGTDGPSGGSGTISGTITIASYPVQGVTVTAGSASATTDSSGNYTITGLAAGSYTVTPSKTNYSFSPASSSVTASDSGITGINFDSGPALPVPASYTQNLPSQSQSILIKEVPLTVTFSPTLSGGYRASDILTCPDPLPSGYTCSGKTFSGSYLPQWIGDCSPISGSPSVASFQSRRITLVDSSGTIVQNPQNNLSVGSGSFPSGTEFGFTLKPLTQRPVLKLIAFWKLVDTPQRYPAYTTTTYSLNVTYGVTQTSTTTFTNTFNASAGVDIKAFKATLSYTFSSAVTNSMSITQTTSTTNSYSVNPGEKQGVLAIWQLVYQIAAVRKATAAEISAGQDQWGNPVDSFGYVPFSDPNFVNGTTNGLNPNDVVPIDIQQQTDIVPQMTLF